MPRLRISQRAAGAAFVLLACALGTRLTVDAARQQAGRSTPAAAVPAGPRLTVPPGFSVREVYPADKAGSIVNLTFDGDGHLVVAKENGPVVRLLDADKDGVFDTEQVVTDAIANCQGLLFAGRDLLATCDSLDKPAIASLYRVPDADGDGRGEAPILVARSTFSISEHGAHALVFGPDGLVYWMIGNFGGLQAGFAPLSPFQNFTEDQLLPVMGDARGHGNQVRAPAGFITRLSLAAIQAATPSQPTPHDIEIVAGGFRNAYDAGFNLAGELFTFDSDMEWDINLPWYRPVRTLHLTAGADYGFRYGSGPWPTAYPDTLPSLSELGRGSPVGVAFYQGEAFPEEYRDAFLLGDWSRGRILAGRQQRAGASYTETISEFVMGTPLNVTDLDVGADGAVYFALGGRRTRGGLYKVWHADAARTRPSPPSDPIARALAQPQPRSAFGRAGIEVARRSAGARWNDGLRAVVSGTDPGPRRARALELLQVHGEAPGVEALAGLTRDASAEVRAAAALLLGLHQDARAQAALVPLLADTDALVARRAIESLVRSGVHAAVAPPFDPVADVLPLLGHPDRHLRYAARQLLRRVHRNRWRDAALAVSGFPAAGEAQVLLAQTVAVSTDVPPLLDRQIALLPTATTDEARITLLRAAHLSLIRSGGVRHASRFTALGEALLALFPTGRPLVDREIGRTLAYLETPGAVPELVTYLTSPGLHREDQLFTMYCLRAIKTGWEQPERQAVVKWFLTAQEQKWRGGASFPGYMRDMWRETLGVLPADERATAEEAMEAFTPPPVITTTGRPQQLGDDATRLSIQELREYMTLDPMAYTGDAARGEQVFGKALCAACHRHGDLGQEAGPDLTSVAQRFGRSDLLDAILEPSKSISDQWASVEIVTRGRKVIAGVVVSEDAERVVVQPVGTPPVTVAVRDIESRAVAKVSPMPEGLLNTLTLREIADLLAFLERAPGN